MPFAYLAGATIVSSLLGANASKQAASIQANATNKATDLQQQVYNTQMAQQAPYRTAGLTALNEIGAELPFLTEKFGPQQLQSSLAPGYGFMLGQGVGAQGQTMNATGGGSNVGIGNSQFAQNYASNAYQNAFNNFQNQQSNIYNRLAGIAGLGQASTKESGSAGQNYANAASQLGIGGAAAQAAGLTGATGSLAGGFTDVAKLNYLSSLMNPSPTSTDMTGFYTQPGINIGGGSAMQSVLGGPIGGTF
jgi:hypothetical protein